MCLSLLFTPFSKPLIPLLYCATKQLQASSPYKPSYTNLSIEPQYQKCQPFGDIYNLILVDHLVPTSLVSLFSSFFSLLSSLFSSLFSLLSSLFSLLSSLFSLLSSLFSLLSPLSSLSSFFCSQWQPPSTRCLHNLDQRYSSMLRSATYGWEHR